MHLAHPWNHGRIIGPKPPLKPKHIWAIRTRLQHEGRIRDLAMFNVAIDSKLRGCDLNVVHASRSPVWPGQRLLHRPDAVATGEARLPASCKDPDPHGCRALSAEACRFARRMTKWFYDHLARLIFAKAVSWKPMHVRQLQEYVDGERKAHYVEGDFGEYIKELYTGESRLLNRSSGGRYSRLERSSRLHWPFPIQRHPRETVQSRVANCHRERTGGDGA
jgi:hypothetical protein